jgi:hypothetical protein
MATDPVRDEAQRLVAAALAAASLAARSAGGGRENFATGSAACCVCPVCRLIEAMRDPDEELTDRLVSGAGDLATAVAGLLRSFGGFGQSGTGADAAAGGGDPWRQATTSTRDDAEQDGTAMPSKAPMAKKATARKAAPGKAAAEKAVPAKTAKRAAAHPQAAGDAG